MENNHFINNKEIELLEFKAGGNSYGIDINDIREILPYNCKPTPIPNAHPFLEGMIMPRDFIIPIINFSASLLLDKKAVDNNTSIIENGSFGSNDEMLIVTSIRNMNIAFHVDSVNGIHKVDTSLIEKAGKKVTSKQKNVIIGIYNTGERNIEIVDLRQIIRIINPNMYLD